MITRVDTSESAARPVRDKPLSPVLIGDMLRILDLVVIGLVGLIGYLLYVYPEHAQISSQYLVTMGIGAMAAAVMLQWFGVYAGEFVFAPLLRHNPISLMFLNGTLSDLGLAETAPQIADEPDADQDKTPGSANDSSSSRRGH